MRTKPFDLAGITFSTLSAGLSNSSGVASSLVMYTETRLPAGTRISSGSNLWSRMTKLNSCASVAPAGARNAASASAQAKVRRGITITVVINEFESSHAIALLNELNDSNLRPPALRNVKSMRPHE